MNESFKDLEDELKQLSPRRVSPELWQRLDSELGASAGAKRPRYNSTTSWTSWKWAGWRLAAVAATVAVVTTIGVMRWAERPDVAAPVQSRPVAPATAVAANPLPAPTPAASPDRYRPVSAANVLYDLKDEGLAYTADNNPGRRLRYRYLDTYTWKNPRSNASLKWSIPRDEVRVVPVNLN